MAPGTGNTTTRRRWRCRVGHIGWSYRRNYLVQLVLEHGVTSSPQINKAVSMKTYSQSIPSAPVMIGQTVERACPPLTLTTWETAAISWPSESERLPAPQNGSAGSAMKAAEAPLIYAVDDMPILTDLYCVALEETGYEV